MHWEFDYVLQFCWRFFRETFVPLQVVSLASCQDTALAPHSSSYCGINIVLHRTIQRIGSMQICCWASKSVMGVESGGTEENYGYNALTISKAFWLSWYLLPLAKAGTAVEFVTQWHTMMTFALPVFHWLPLAITALAPLWTEIGCFKMGMGRMYVHAVEKVFSNCFNVLRCGGIF